MNPIKMRHKHDCKNCIPLGQLNEHDLYYCSTEPTVIARYGSDGPDYKSGMAFVGNDIELTMAYKIAHLKNLINS